MRKYNYTVRNSAKFPPFGGRSFKLLLTMILITASVLLTFGITVHAEDENPSQETSEYVSVPEESEPSYTPEPSEPEPSYKPEPSEPSYEPDPFYEPSQHEPEPEPSYEPEPEPSYEPDPSYEPVESISINIIDPFKNIAGVKYILPSDNPKFTPPESSIDDESSAESSEEAAAIINTSSKLETTPPIVYDEHSAVVTYESETDNSSFLIGMIFWSIIGVIVTAVLILILNFKGNKTEFAFSRKRYHKGANNSTRTNKYNI